MHVESGVGKKLRVEGFERPKKLVDYKKGLPDVHLDRVSLRPPPATNMGLKPYLMLHLLLV
jgi:hypothetical protein